MHACMHACMQCNALHCTQRNATQRNATQRNAMQCNAMQCNVIQCNTIQYNTYIHTLHTHIHTYIYILCIGLFVLSFWVQNCELSATTELSCASCKPHISLTRMHWAAQKRYWYCPNIWRFEGHSVEMRKRNWVYWEKVRSIKAFHTSGMLGGTWKHLIVKRKSQLRSGQATDAFKNQERFTFCWNT